MTDRKKLTQAIYDIDFCSWAWSQKIADHLLANGVTFGTDNNVGNIPIIPGHTDCHDIAEMAYNNGYANGCEDSKPKWIPVSERLPGIFQAVIVWTKFKEIGEAHYNGKQFQWIDDEGCYDHAHVTHWMPLPEPPGTK